MVLHKSPGSTTPRGKFLMTSFRQVARCLVERCVWCHGVTSRKNCSAGWFLKSHGGEGKGFRLKKPCNDRPLFDPPEMLNAPLTKLYLQAPRLTFHSVGKTMLVMTCCWYRQIAFVQLYNWTRPCSVFSSEDQARCISHDLIDHSISL